MCLGIHGPGPAVCQPTLGARAVALGGAATALPGNSWAVFSNPALVSDERVTIAFFGMRYYGLPELTDVAAVLTYPSRFGVLGAGAHSFGDELYRESRIRLMYAFHYQRFYGGAALNYSHVRQGGGYGSAGALGVDMGLGARLTKHLQIGAAATNINQPKYGRINNIDEDLPRSLSIGLAFRLSERALFTSDVFKDVRFPLAYRAGLDAEIVDRLWVRVGITTHPRTFSGGLGYQAGGWAVSIVVQRHRERALGYSPGVDFEIYW